MHDSIKRQNEGENLIQTGPTSAALMSIKDETSPTGDNKLI
jgi:hypothetical protein